MALATAQGPTSTGYLGRGRSQSPRGLGQPCRALTARPLQALCPCGYRGPAGGTRGHASASAPSLHPSLPAPGIATRLHPPVNPGAPAPSSCRLCELTVRLPRCRDTERLTCLVKQRSRAPPGPGQNHGRLCAMPNAPRRTDAPRNQTRPVHPPPPPGTRSLSPVAGSQPSATWLRPREGSVPHPAPRPDPLPLAVETGRRGSCPHTRPGRGHSVRRCQMPLLGETARPGARTHRPPTASSPGGLRPRPTLTALDPEQSVSASLGRTVFICQRGKHP